FLVATSCQGKQVRITLGRWPLLNVEAARAQALEILRDCRNGRMPVRTRRRPQPTLYQATLAYAQAKAIKPSSLKRYQSILQTHFAEWLAQPVTSLGDPAFFNHCSMFATSKSGALVSVGRAFIGALIKYVNAVYNQ